MAKKLGKTSRIFCAVSAIALAQFAWGQTGGYSGSGSSPNTTGGSSGIGSSPNARGSSSGMGSPGMSSSPSSGATSPTYKACEGLTGQSRLDCIDRESRANPSSGSSSTPRPSTGNSSGMGSGSSGMGTNPSSGGMR